MEEEEGCLNKGEMAVVQMSIGDGEIGGGVGCRGTCREQWGVWWWRFR